MNANIYMTCKLLNFPCISSPNLSVATPLLLSFDLGNDSTPTDLLNVLLDIKPTQDLEKTMTHRQLLFPLNYSAESSCFNIFCPRGF